MIGKLLGWAAIFVAVVMLLSWNEDMWFLAPDPYEGMLIGRVSSGMDRKGRQTRKMIR
jgi:hypothetical protein